MWIIALILMLSTHPSMVQAHPGSLDSSGCHYCTNCTAYGDLYKWEGNLYEYYHCGYNLIIPPSNNNDPSDDTPIGDRLNSIQEQPAYVPILPTSEPNKLPDLIPLPTWTPRPTWVPFATWTPRPTSTPRPKYKPISIPTNTPLPTLLQTKKPTPSEIPSVLGTQAASNNDNLIFYGSLFGILSIFSFIIYRAINQLWPFQGKS